MGDLKGFNAAEIEPTSFDVLPAGDYEVAIVDSTVQATKSGEGKMLLLELQILSGPKAGRKLFDRLNLWNPSAQAQTIARGTLSAICRAVGVLTPEDSSDLYGKPLVATVKIRNDPQYGDSNVIKAYKRCENGGKFDLPPRGEPAPNDEIPF